MMIPATTSNFSVVPEQVTYSKMKVCVAVAAVFIAFGALFGTPLLGSHNIFLVRAIAVVGVELSLFCMAYFYLKEQKDVKDAALIITALALTLLCVQGAALLPLSPFVRTVLGGISGLGLISFALLIKEEKEKEHAWVERVSKLPLEEVGEALEEEPYWQIKVNSQGHTLFQQAFIDNDFELGELLIARRGKIEKEFLRLAFQERKVEWAFLLLLNKCDPDEMREYAERARNLALVPNSDANKQKWICISHLCDAFATDCYTGEENLYDWAFNNDHWELAASIAKVMGETVTLSKPTSDWWDQVTIRPEDQKKIDAKKKDLIEKGWLDLTYADILLPFACKNKSKVKHVWFSSYNDTYRKQSVDYDVVRNAEYKFENWILEGQRIFFDLLLGSQMSTGKFHRLFALFKEHKMYMKLKGHWELAVKQNCFLAQELLLQEYPQFRNHVIEFEPYDNEFDSYERREGPMAQLPPALTETQ